MEKREETLTGENADWCSHGGKQSVRSFLKKVKMELPFIPVFPVLDIYPKSPNISIQKNLCTPMFTEALSTIAKIWKQPKYPLVDKQIKTLWYIHIMEYYTAVKTPQNS